jgi:hypothetical protein
VANLVYTNTKLLPATQVGVQTRAYELYELRRRIDGRAEQDWYQAETDLTASSKTKRSGHKCNAGTLVRHCVNHAAKTGVVLWFENILQDSHAAVSSAQEMTQS